MKLTNFTKEQRNELRVYKSHNIAGGFYKIEYAIKDFEQNTITTPQISIVENVGGPKLSLLCHLAN